MRPPETTGALLRRLALPAAFVALIFWALWNRAPAERPEGAAQPAEGQVLRGETMGTTFEIRLVGAVDAAAAREAVAAALEEVDRLMSTWRPDSELSRFNAAGAGAMTVSAPTVEVLALAQRVYEATGGAFDVTVGPLVARWGFGPGGERPAPTKDEITDLLTHVGLDKLRLEGRTLTKADARVQVDVAGIAKGYGVDRVADALAALPGFRGVMVEIGGEVRVIGGKADGQPWRLAIERPDEERRAVHSVVALRAGGLATSGDYRRFIDEGAERRTHVVDPRTGRPVQHGVASASVLAPDCATADAWATALMVLAPDEGLEKIEADATLEAQLIVRTSAGMTVRATAGFAAAAQDAKGVVL